MINVCVVAGKTALTESDREILEIVHATVEHLVHIYDTHIILT